MELRDSINKVKERIAVAAAKSGRNPSAIRLIAVSKTVDSETARRAYELGITDFGENRIPELNHKLDQLPQARWHLIGRLQSNKAKEAVGKAALIHSLDRWNLAEELDKRGQKAGVEVPCLLQVNVAGEEQKAGIAPQEVKQFLKAAGQLQSVRIYGLMTMAPLLADSEEARPVFRELFAIKEELGRHHYENVDLRYLSMGMSQDYEVAIEEGANMIRVGSAIFSP